MKPYVKKFQTLPLSWTLGDEVFDVSPSRTQPETLFAEESDEDEEADKEPEWKKRKIWGDVSFSVKYQAATLLSPSIPEPAVTNWALEHQLKD